MPDEAPRPSPLSLFPVTTGLLAVLAVVFGVEVLLGGSTSPAVLLRMGANFPELVKEGEVWRLLTAALLHVGPLHLLMNGLALWQLGRFCEITFGSSTTLALFVGTALTGSLAAVGIVEGTQAIAAATGWPVAIVPRLSAGASGALFGLEGALVAFFLRHRERLTPAGRALLRQLLIWSVGMMVFSVVVPGIDWMAHLGGLVGGLAVGWALPARGQENRPLTRALASLAVALLVVASAGPIVAEQPREYSKEGVVLSAPGSWRQVDLPGFGLVVVDELGLKVAALEVPAPGPREALDVGLKRFGLAGARLAADVREVEGGFLRRAFIETTEQGEELGGFVQARCEKESCVVVVALAPGERYGRSLPQLSRIASSVRAGG